MSGKRLTLMVGRLSDEWHASDPGSDMTQRGCAEKSPSGGSNACNDCGDEEPEEQ